ncbi:hypothetical protein GWI33_002062 [Rhynchophorus ferrugineus]|uniref:endo-polygalacturonase n=1 Tax=Rhynchophorus ferrugineus TaxID=354439 RepID=A0A834IZS2_RHYFE|nr:hypothetical protein GWI33_002062 [Rhynchophorus ferrugineus]
MIELVSVFSVLILGLDLVNTQLILDPCQVTDFDDIQQAVSNCQKIILKDVVIPEKTSLEMRLLTGTELIFEGNITHVPAEWAGDLLRIYGSNLTISGAPGHVFDGLGAKHWKGKNETVVMRPKLLRFKVSDSTIKNLHLLNCPDQCIHISSSSNVHVSDIFIDVRDGYQGVAPTDHFATNTDGIDVSGSDRIFVQDIVVYNQDDCVAINGGHDLYFRNFFCNGSHGLSLSVSGGEVYNIEFKDSIVQKARFAIHVKTHNEGTEGHIYNVFYKNITFSDVFKAGISIQQNYPQGDVRGNVPITNLTLVDVQGSVLAETVPISVLCAEDACSDWSWTNVRVTGTDFSNECLNVPDGIDC